MQWAAVDIGADANRPAILRAIAAAPGGFALESLASHAAYGRYSIYGIGDVLPRHAAADSFAALDATLRPFATFATPAPLPFVGGWVGFLGYECGRFIEPFPRRHTGLHEFPATHWIACDTVLIHDHTERRWIVAGCEPSPRGKSRPPLEERLATMQRWAEACGTGFQPVPPAERSSIGFPPAPTPVENRCHTNNRRPTESDRTGDVQCNLTRDEYLARINRALEYIRAGDIYQVNFAQRFDAPLIGAPIDLYERLGQCNPAMFAAYLSWDHDALGIPRSGVLSSSPELFLHLRDGHVTTRPIKGTRPRGGDAAADAAAARELETSEKERAELVMIVDLERNDLGRVCRYGSVRVTCAGETETHPTVLHRVATVEGDLRPGCDALDLLRATFPGGSITGAPKVRAMQIIDELEPSPRGPYCGAIGWIGVDGSMMLNLAIRTMAVRGNRVFWWAGGGIVADSDPQAEYEETLAKAQGMRRAMIES